MKIEISKAAFELLVGDLPNNKVERFETYSVEVFHVHDMKIERNWSNLGIPNQYFATDINA